MTIKSVLTQGFHTRHEHGDPAKLNYLAMQSARRFMDLEWVLEARRLNLRTAHRRWCRRNGLRFNGSRR